jgi:L-ascorbate metabolism protein UlaG (beta-lactamase superfamily)
MDMLTPDRRLTLPSGSGSSELDGDVLFIGTATTLIRFGGFTVITDPNFLHRGEHARLGMGLRSERLTEPAMQISDLPPIDFVVLSHHHGDHFDDRAARELRKSVPIITTQQAGEKLDEQGFGATISLETWEYVTVERGDATVRVTAMPAKHAPEAVSPLIPPVIGTMLDFERDGRHLLRLYITGDTLMHDELHEIPRRYPDIDLALIHLGGTQILGVLLTMDAEQGIEALEIVRPRTAIPIHFDDYTVFRSPLEDFQTLVEQRDLATDVHYLNRGESYPLRATAEIHQR